jgi:hypothetical protein
VRQPRWPRWLVGAAASFAAGFLPYLDLPLRVWRGSTWHYDRPDTWAGFWRIFSGQEVAGLQRPLTTFPALTAAASDVARALLATFTWPGLALVAAAACVALWPGRKQPLAPMSALIAATYLAFGVIFRPAVLLEAEMLGALLAMSVLLALGLSRLPRRRAALGALACIALTVGLALRNFPVVRSLTGDEAAVRYIDQLTHLEAPPGAVVMEPWGGNYFALAYAQRIEGRLPGWQLVDHRANMADLAAAQGRIYTTAATLFVFGPEWWASRLGSPLRLTSAGPKLVALTALPLPAPTTKPLPLDADVGLVDWHVRILGETGQLLVRLDWVTRRPLAEDYSTYVHVTDQSEIIRPEDLVAQSDYAAPVDGWYPTSTWQPNEVVREHHVLAVPAGRSPRAILVGMYKVGAAGEFEHIGQIAFTPDSDGRWLVRP